jgi:hypothetical protein
MLHDAQMSSIVEMPKTFQNYIGFERGFWQLKIGRFSTVPKTRVFGGFEMHSAF